MNPPSIDESGLPPEQVSLTIGRVLSGGAILSIVLAFLTWSLSGGGSQLHGTLEVVSTVIAFGIGVLAFVRYLSQRRLLFIFVSAGFFGTGMLDGFHAFVTSEAYRAAATSMPENLDSWSGLVPRIVLGITLWAGVSDRWPNRFAEIQAERRQESLIYISVSALVLTALVAYFFVPLPSPFVSIAGVDSLMAFEILAAIPFGLALWTLWRGGRWRHHAFERWLVFALALSILCQAAIAPFSDGISDGAFVLAHLVKVTSYGVVFIGLAASMAEIHRGADESARRLDRALREHAEAERQIRLFQDVVRNMQIGLTVWRLDEPSDVGSFRLMATNPAASEIAGVGIDERVGLTLAESFPEALQTELPHIYRQVLETGEPIHLQNVADSMGGILNVRVFALPEKSIGVTFENVTERAKAEAALAASERHVRAVAETAREAIISMDFAGAITFWNQGAQRLFGYAEDEIMGSPISKIMPERYREAHAAGIARVREGDERRVVGRSVDLHGLRSDGKEFPLELSLAEWQVDGESFFTGIIRDMTEQKAAEAALRSAAERLAASNRDLESFAYVASHDLQEPLRKIIAFGDRLTVEYDRALDERGHDYITRMKYAATRMQTLIADLLLLSRVATRIEAFTQIDLNEIVSEVVSDLESRIIEVGGQVEVHPLPFVEADRTQMCQLFQNLMVNALKFYREGVPPVVVVRALPPGAGTDKDHVTILVEDNGLGFDMKYVDQIFKPFERLHPRQRFEGSGIGLSICRSIAVRHGGTLTAESVPGKGSTFLVTLPAHQKAQEMS